MMSNLTLMNIKSHSFDPYYNLAMEEYLLNGIKDNQCILYLWQNKNTVVIGRNQNPYIECKLTELEATGGLVARRLSGGGCVYHDLGNLNFTFLATAKDYNVAKQLEVILAALSKLGIKGEKTGRNDLTVDGKKFSGNAFYESAGKCYHHGTLLVDVNMDDRGRFLTVSRDKLESKGIKSVVSRVANLKEFNSELNIEILSEKLIEAFGDVYEGEVVKIAEEQINQEEIETLRKRYQSHEWKYGKRMIYSASAYGRFGWGAVDIRFKLVGFNVEQVQIFSDALDYQLIEKIISKLPDCSFNKISIAERIKQVAIECTDEEKTMIEDILSVIGTLT